VVNNLFAYLKIGEVLYRALKLEQRIYIILTFVTAGQAFGFSRAFLLLVNEQNGMLEGIMGIGPTSQEDANRVWTQMSQENKSLEELLADYDKIGSKELMPLYPLVRKLNFPLAKKEEAIIQCLEKKEVLKITNAYEDSRVSEEFIDVLGVNEFVCLPLAVEDKPIGVLLADNLYSSRAISDENVRALAVVASVLGAAIEGARIHRELLENQKKLRKMAEELRRSYILASVGEMAGYLSHEIRNPVVAIGGLVRYVYEEIDKPERLEKVKKRLKTIMNETGRLEKLLQETLDFVRLDKLTLQYENINKITEEICDLMERELEERGIKIIRYLASDFYLQMDRDRMKQVLSNLIHNAAEAMSQGGEIKIKTQKEKQFVKVEMIDNGPGIPPEIREKVFAPFFTTKSQGSGLGLSVVKHIVEQHGGYVEIESEGDKGTSVSVYLPIRPTDLTQ
jgi:signal transduction histidine kinase